VPRPGERWGGNKYDPPWGGHQKVPRELVIPGEKTAGHEKKEKSPGTIKKRGEERGHTVEATGGQNKRTRVGRPRKQPVKRNGREDRRVWVMGGPKRGAHV